jgi:hypothetical protein
MSKIVAQSVRNLMITAALGQLPIRHLEVQILPPQPATPTFR